MITPEYLTSIDPKKQGEKYSENLHKWLKKHRNVPLFVAFSEVSDLNGKPVYHNPNKTQCNQIYIGYGDMNDGWVNGAKLSAIITNGTKAQSWAYSAALKFTPLNDWFTQYQVQGKCLIDPSHLFYPERWDSEENTRQCKWCEKKEQRITRMVPSYHWEGV